MEIKMQKYTRLATNDDLISIMKIIDNAKEFLKNLAVLNGKTVIQMKKAFLRILKIKADMFL